MASNKTETQKIPSSRTNTSTEKKICSDYLFVKEDNKNMWKIYYNLKCNVYPYEKFQTSMGVNKS